MDLLTISTRSGDLWFTTYTSAQRSAEIANNRYRAGLVSYLDVVFAQQTLLQNQQAVAQLQGQQAGPTVGIIRALGGGW